MTKPKKPAAAASEPTGRPVKLERAPGGGSYIRDPQTGTLERVAGTERPAADAPAQLPEPPADGDGAATAGDAGADQQQEG